MNAPGPDKAAAVRQLHAAAAHVRTLRAAARGDAGLARDRLALRAWQAERLARTHRDLLASPRYGPAAAFFLAELYGPQDQGARDAAIERILPTLARILPAPALETIALALELEALSEALDLALVRQLRSRASRGALAITPETYAVCYRAASDRSARERQIALVGRVGAALNRLARKPLIAGALRIMAGPARAAGLSALHAFLARGYAAFRHLRDADEFLATIGAREQRINDQLYAGAARPFAVDDGG